MSPSTKKGPPPPLFLKIDKCISERFALLLVAAWQPVLTSQQHDLDVTVCGNRATWNAMLLDVALFLILHPPPLHQLATCSEAALLCTRQSSLPPLLGWIWHHGIHSDSQDRLVDSISHREETGWHQFQRPLKTLSLAFSPLLVSCCTSRGKTQKERLVENSVHKLNLFCFYICGMHIPTKIP